MSKMISAQDIERSIYRIRGQHVMLDSDLALLYGVSTKRLNEQVRRNVRRFPQDFMFQLSPQEIESLRPRNATLEKGRRGEHRKYRPYVFTEEGVDMHETDIRLLVQDVQKLKKRPGPGGPINPSIY